MRYVSLIGIAMVVILFGASLCTGQSCEWPGKWRLSAGDFLDIQQTGDAVTGTVYDSYGNVLYRISGKVLENELTGDTLSAAGYRLQPFDLVMSEDCTYFTGYWTGNRIKPNKPEDSSNAAQNCSDECKKRDPHLLWNGKNEYPYCNCICEDDWEFGADGKTCVLTKNESGAGSTAVLLVQNASGTNEFKSGDTCTLSPQDKIRLIAKCKEFVELVNATMGDDWDFKSAIGYLALIRSQGHSFREGSMTPQPPPMAFGQAMVDLMNCTYFCGRLLDETKPKPVTKSASDNPPLLGSSINQSDSPAQIELGLESGPFLAEVVNDEVFLSVKTDTATVTSFGENTFGVAYDPSNSTTFVAAYQGPVSVQPTNSNLTPFILDAGQIVDVNSEGAGPAVSLDQLGINGTAPGSGATGVPGTGNATAGNVSPGGEGISAPGGPITPGASGTGTPTVSPSGNSQLGDTADISAGQSIRQTISPAGSSNFYRFQADSSGIVKLKLEDVPRDMRPYLCLYDKNLAPISEKSASNAGDVLNLEKDVQGPGQFYIEAKDIDGKAHGEPYTLNVVFEPAPDQNEPNPNYFLASDAKSGENINAYICPGSDEDFYKIFVDTSGILKLKLDGVPADMRSYLQLYDMGLGNSIASSSASSPGDKVRLEKGVQGPGWFYIRVQEADGKAHSEPYTLNVAFESAPDQYEPNPNYFRATQIEQGQSTTAYICPSGDEDFYKFYLGSSGIVKVTLDSVPADMRPWLQLYDKGFGNSIASSTASSPGDKVRLEKGVQGPGWFYIRVQDADGRAHGEPYTLTVAL